MTYAFTAPGSSYPPYINITRLPNGLVRVMVRGPAVDGACGPCAYIELDDAEYDNMRTEKV